MSVEQLKKALRDEKCTFGLSETMKNLKRGKVSTVFLASDCHRDVKEKLSHYGKLGKLSVMELEINGAEIGTLAKRQFSISIVSY